MFEKKEAVKQQKTEQATENVSNLPAKSQVNFDTMLPADISDDDYLSDVFKEMAARHKAQKSHEITANYLTFDDWQKGEERHYIFAGMTTMQVPDRETGEMKEMAAVKLVDENRAQWITGATVVVSSLKKLDKVFAPVTIQCNGKAKGKGYYDIRVFSY